jgi:hypothetical protein
LLSLDANGSVSTEEMHMRSLHAAVFLAALGIAGAGIVGCSDGNTPVSPGGDSGSTASGGTSGGSSGGNAAGSGMLTVRLTDSPYSDATALLVTFSEVSVHQADPGDWKTIPFAAGASRTCDLKKLQGPVDVLGVGSLPAAKYTQIRLHVSSAAIYFNGPSSGGPCGASVTAPGTGVPVEIPSGEVKLNHPFTVATTGTTITLDFDGEQSIHQTGGGNGNGGNGKGNGNGNGGGKSDGKYMMSPVIRVVSVQ